MSKFINTQNRNTIDCLVEGFKEQIKSNTYYMHSDRKATIGTYFNLNIKKSTLDESLRINYSNLGNDSPLRYNKINNFYLYGMEKITTDLDLGDYGVEASSIEGELIVLPNTIIPYPQDYFYINYLNKEYLFKVLSVSTDTLEDGANFYKVQYKLDRINTNQIEKLVVEEFEMIINNTGTNLNSVIRSTEYKFIESVDMVLDKLKEYYISLFYNKRVQTFTYHELQDIYDPFMIEFITKNNLLLSNENFIYINHQTALPKTFSLDYDKTIFRRLELKDNEKRPVLTFSLRYIDQPLSILSTRVEQYFEVQFRNIDFGDFVHTQDLILIDNIIDNKLFDKDYRNVIIKYFNNQDLTSEDIKLIDDIEYKDSKELFYNIPIMIYCLESYVKTVLNKKE